MRHFRLNFRKKFVHSYDADRKTLLEKVYRKKEPALYLSSFSEFFSENKNDVYLRSIIKTGFTKLIDTYLLPLRAEHPDAPIHLPARWPPISRITWLRLQKSGTLK
jgi:glucosamine kinase